MMSRIKKQTYEGTGMTNECAIIMEVATQTSTVVEVVPQNIQSGGNPKNNDNNGGV